MDYFSAFDVDAAAQHEEQKAARHASILTHQRLTSQFEGFLRGAAHKDEFDVRAELIRRDLDRTVAEAAREAGVEDTAEHARLADVFLNHIAGGAFCDDCRKWKSGPKAGTCVCDDNGEGALSDDESAVGDKEAKVSFRVIATGEDSLGGKGDTAVPFSKKKHAPEVPEKSGDKQDVADAADYSDEPDLGKTEDVSKKHDIKGDNTDTWSGKGGQADPVTSHFLSDEAVDSALARS